MLSRSEPWSWKAWSLIAFGCILAQATVGTLLFKVGAVIAYLLGIWYPVLLCVAFVVCLVDGGIREARRKRPRTVASAGARPAAEGLGAPAASQPRKDAGPYESRDSHPAERPPRH